jgi:aminoglycoside 3-N-acetyltransferase
MNNTDLIDGLLALGLRHGDIVMVHSAYTALGIRDPELIIQAICHVIGDTGTLLMPGLSYAQQPPTVHNTRTTPTCVGFLSEYLRTRPGTQRSLHPTHSVCGIGACTAELLGPHHDDRTPCGTNSPFNKLFHQAGKILMLGCGLHPNTAMHAVEEYVVPPYLFGPPVTYQITDANGQTYEATYTAHNFAGVEQRYDRVALILPDQALRRGMVGQAPSYLIDAPILLHEALVHLRRDPYFFVDQVDSNG